MGRPLHIAGRQQRESRIGELFPTDRGLSPWQGINGISRNLGDPVCSSMEVVTDKVKTEEGNDDILGVGLTHSRGVAGVTACDTDGSVLEGVSDQSQTAKETPGIHRDAAWVETRLSVISKMARTDSGCRFNNLACLLNEDYLARCFWELEKGAAPGIDKVTWRSYAKDLSENLSDLLSRMRAMKYRPQAVRRVYIPKDGKSTRPLGIPAVEDKIVQMGISRILESIYEQDFLDVSYGFRPGRNCHQALKALDRCLMTRPVNYVLDADIKGFFDSVDHKLLLKCLEARICDKNFLRLIVRILKAGVMESGKCLETEEGTPQGGVVSPILANIFLHYALDKWFATVLTKQLKGYAELIRYADDFVICVQHKEDAEKILSMLDARFTQCGLTLSKEKTRLLEFGRFAKVRADSQGKRPGSFDFLGFTHYCDLSRTGKFKVGRKTSKKKFRLKAVALNDWLRQVRNAVPLNVWWDTLCRKLSGHYNYYAISGNYVGVYRFYRLALRLAFKWLNRRSQRRSSTWTRYNLFLATNSLPHPYIRHNLYGLCLLSEAD